MYCYYDVLNNKGFFGVKKQVVFYQCISLHKVKVQIDRCILSPQ